MGQLLVSRSYYDAVSRRRSTTGSRTDKHVREHEIYAIGYPGEFTLTQHKLSSQAQKKDATSGLMGMVGAGLSGVYGIIKSSSAKSRAIVGGVLLLPLVVWGSYQVFMSHRPAPPAKQVWCDTT
jgi:hypothetical protein